MTKVFLYLANRSIRVGFLILAVIGLRFLFRKLPKGPQLLLWAVVALRLAVPFSPESPWSLLPSAEPLSSQATINTPLQRDPSILQAENEISVPAATKRPTWSPARLLPQPPSRRRAVPLPQVLWKRPQPPASVIWMSFSVSAPLSGFWAWRL